jgi:hypothetical protein
MVIELDTNKLITMGLSPDEYVFLLMSNSNASIQELKLNVDLDLLQTNGWVKLGEDDQVIIRDKFETDTVSDFDQMWAGLLSRFPIKVINQGSVRILRAKDASSKANEKAKSKYKKVVGTDKTKHERILNCLERELDLRRRGNGLGYMQMLETWVNNHSWEKYDIDVDNTDGTTKPSNLESGRITRHL